MSYEILLVEKPIILISHICTCRVATFVHAVGTGNRNINSRLTGNRIIAPHLLKFTFALLYLQE